VRSHACERPFSNAWLGQLVVRCDTLFEQLEPAERVCKFDAVSLNIIDGVSLIVHNVSYVRWFASTFSVLTLYDPAWMNHFPDSDSLSKTLSPSTRTVCNS